jgi:hypothetical protein
MKTLMSGIRCAQFLNISANRLALTNHSIVLKIFVPVLIAFLGLNNVSFAQTYTIGTGNTNNTNSGITPLSTVYEDNRNQMIYLASELIAEGASAGNIVSIALNISSIGSPAPENVSIKLANVAAGNNVGGFAAVTGEVTTYTSTVENITSTGWYTFNFTTPFAWNGTSNIAVEICRDNTSWSSNFGVRTTQLPNNDGGRRNYGFYLDNASGCSMTSGNVANSGPRRHRPNMQFTFGTICTTPTVGGTLTVNPSSTVVNDVVVLNVTGNGGSVVRYEYSFDNFATAPQSLISNLNTLEVFTPVNEPSIWFRAVSVGGGCPEGLSNVVLLSLDCAPIYSLGTSDGDYITNVTFNGINNNSTSDAGNDAYQNFTNFSTNVCAGSAYTLSASGTFTFGANQGFAAWIDWNGDGIYSNAENVLISAPTATASTSVTIPTNAFNGAVKMRVLCVWNQTPTNEACANFDYQYGEIEEYTIVINHPTTSTITETSCDSFVLNSTTYNSSGVYTQVLTNSAGCDSTITLNLTILESTFNTITASACNSYTLNNQTYSSSGVYTQSLQNAAGCDSTITLNLTINFATMTLNGSATPATLGFANGSATVSITGGNGPFTYQWNDPFEQTTATTYGVFPGNYTCTVTDGNGCDDVITVNVPLDLGFELTQVSSAFCNTSGHLLSDVISCDAVAGAQNYRWELTPIGDAALPEYTRGYGNRNLRLSWVSGIELGKTYEVRVKAFVGGGWSDYGTVCTISTSASVPQTQVASGSSPFNPTSGLPYVMCNGLLADYVYAAERFEWEFAGANTIVAESPSYHIQLNSVPGLLMNSTYDVRVRVRVNGQWGSFGTSLPIQIGAPANTQIIASLCGSTRALNQAIAAINTCGATSYTFRFQHGTEAERILVRTPYTCPLWQVQPALTPGETYSVSVKVNQGGEEGSYSTACNVTIAGPQAESIADDLLMNKSISESTLGIYPNPNSGTEVRIDLDGIEEGTHDVSVTIYNIFGKLITNDSFGHQGSRLSRLVSFENELATGIYLINITVDGENFATEKLIVK